MNVSCGLQAKQMLLTRNTGEQLKNNITKEEMRPQLSIKIKKSNADWGYLLPLDITKNNHYRQYNNIFTVGHPNDISTTIAK